MALSWSLRSEKVSLRPEEVYFLSGKEVALGGDAEGSPGAHDD